MHDAVDTGGYGNVYPGIRRAIDELVRGGDFDEAPPVGTMAHLLRRTP